MSPTSGFPAVLRLRLPQKLQSLQSCCICVDFVFRCIFRTLVRSIPQTIRSKMDFSISSFNKPTL